MRNETYTFAELRITAMLLFFTHLQKVIGLQVQSFIYRLLPKK